MEGLEVPMTGDMEYGRGKRKHDKKLSSDDDSDGQTTNNGHSVREQVNSNFNPVFM